MKITRTERFLKDFRQLPQEIRDRTIEALRRLAENPRHPSLHTKRMQGTEGIYELRVSKSYRVTFLWRADEVILRRVGTHDLLRAP